MITNCKLNRDLKTLPLDIVTAQPAAGIRLPGYTQGGDGSGAFLTASPATLIIGCFQLLSCGRGPMVSFFQHASRWKALSAAVLAAVSFAAFSAASAQNQTTPPIYGGNPGAQETGSATGGVFAPVLDSEKRPITAGGFVKTGPIVFEDISKKAGLTSWHHAMGTPEKNYIIETTGSGCRAARLRQRRLARYLSRQRLDL